MKKETDWSIKLISFIDEVRRKPFKWGEWDCCAFSDGAIKAMTGEHLIPKSLKWKNKKTAVEAIRKYGGTIVDAIEKAAKANKLQPMPTSFITTGDLVVFKRDNKNMVGICDGYYILNPGDEGVECSDNTLAVRVWRIG